MAIEIGGREMRTRLTTSRALRGGPALLALLALLALFASASNACVVNEAESPARGVVVSGPPPPAVREERPSAPGPQSVWVVGYWHWTGMQYAWIPGHWDAPPPGAVWNAPVYSARDGKYFYETGGWTAPQTRNALR